MEEAFSDDERDNHWWMVVGEVNEVGIYGDTFLLYSKRWDIYMRDKVLLIKGGYYVAL